jgi:hypothetical protein
MPSQIGTRVSADSLEVIEIYSGQVRDAIILIRSTAEQMALHDLRLVEFDYCSGATNGLVMKVTMKR